MIPLEEGSARRRDLYPTTHDTHIWQMSMPPVGFKPEIPASERPQTHALNRAATAIGLRTFISVNYSTIPRTQTVFVHSLIHSHKAVKQRDIPALRRVISSFSYLSMQGNFLCFCLNYPVTPHYV
jgi:hypothetical protein